MKSMAEQILVAARVMDWQQVENGGPPCFHLESEGRFCGRAQRWEGHEAHGHEYVSLERMVAGLLAGKEDRAASSEAIKFTEWVNRQHPAAPLPGAQASMEELVKNLCRLMGFGLSRRGDGYREWVSLGDDIVRDKQICEVLRRLWHMANKEAGA